MSKRMTDFQMENEMYLKVFPQRFYFAKFYAFKPSSRVLKIHFIAKIKIYFILKVVFSDDLAWIRRNSERAWVSGDFTPSILKLKKSKEMTLGSREFTISGSYLPLAYTIKCLQFLKA